MNESAREVLEIHLGSQERTALRQRLSLSNRMAIIAVLALTFIAYAGTLGYQFVYDDRSQIVENSFVQSWANAPQFFTEHVWQHVYPNSPGNYYRPIFLIWLLLNYTLFGLNAFSWHLTTVTVHLAATALVYVFARRLSKDELTATIAALVFGLHPVHLESVAWVSGVTDPLLA